MADPVSGSTIRVVSYNLRALKQDRAALVRVVRRLRPDVLLLQEVPRHPFSGHRIAAFAADCGLTWGAGPRFRMSTTLLTSLRLDVLESHHGALRVSHHDEPRGYAVATVALPGHAPLRAASLHMSLREQDRSAHVADVLAALSGEGLPLVVGGDLNETPGHDVWRGLGRTLHEVTPDRFTFPAARPVERIDAIFASAGLPAAPPRVELDHADLVAATDHLPVAVDLDLGSLRRT